MTSHEDRPFTPRLFAVSMRGTRDDAMNCFSPDINLADSDGPRYGSSDKDEPQRWLALVLDEEETDLLLRITAMVKADEEVSEEGRFLAEKLNMVVQACAQGFATYEQRKAEDLPTSTPIAS
jgi:hypothetical protein